MIPPYWSVRFLRQLASVCSLLALSVITAVAADMSFSAPTNLTGLVASPIAVAAADLDGDGKPDLAVLSSASNSVTILHSNGNGTFANTGSFDTGLFGPTALAFGDFNHDGKPDLAIVSQSSGTVTILTNNGSGTFSVLAPYATSETGIKGVAAVNFNGDGWDNLALLGSSSVSLHLNNHSGSFTVSPNSTTSTASSIKAADYNHDGRSDLLVISTSAVSILLGQSDGSFTSGPSVAATFPKSAAMADFDGDGFSDLAIVRSNGTAFVLPGNGDGTFGLQVPVSSGLTPNDIAAAEFSSDSKTDLIFTDNQFFSGSEFALALNTTTHLWSTTYPKFGTASSSSIQLLAKLLVAGNVYAVCVPAPLIGTTLSPTSNQVKNGQDGFGNSLSSNQKGSVSVAANTETSISCNFLSPTTSYDVYVVAEASSPPYLQATPIKITIATAPETPILDPATFVEARGFTASWTGLSLATSYQLDVSPVPDFSSFAPNYNSRDVGLTSSLAVTGLSPNTTYYVRVRAVFSGSASMSSNSVSLTTLTVPGTPTLGAATNITPYDFIAHWGTVAGATNYFIDVSNQADFSTFVNIFDNWNVGSTNSYLISATPGGTYYYRVRAANINGSSNSSSPAVITLPPTTPFAGTIATVSTSGFTAFWGPSTGAGSYRLDVASDPEFTIYLPNFTNRDVGNVTSFLVSGTTPGVTYYYRVRAYSSGQSSLNSQTIAVPVPAVPPVSLNAPRAYLTGSGPSSSVSADFNGDGILDVAVANHNSNTVTILIGTGDGSFIETATLDSGNAPWRIASADFNMDGKADLITLNSDSFSVFLGNGDGTFMTAVPAFAAANASDFVIGDFNKDGIPDLAVPSPSGNSIYILPGTGDGTFGQAITTAANYLPSKLVAADFNGDGTLDLAVTNSVNQYSIFIGKGDGTFQGEVTHSTTWLPTHISAADINKDGKIDIVMTTTDTASGVGTSFINILLGAGNGTFTEQPALPCGVWPQALALADLDNDSKPDILTSTNSGKQMELRYGSGDGTFAAAVTMTTPQSVSSLNISDFNNDARQDIGLTSYSTGFFTVFQQSTIMKTFIGAPANYFAGSGTPVSLATGDFDKDGKIDLAAAIHNSATIISLKGDGSGHLTTKTDIPLGGHTPTGILVTDLNKDGASDIVTTGDSSANISVLINNGTGTFPAAVPYAAFGAQYRSAVGDFNGDGNPDLVVANPYAGKVSILLGSDTGTFGLQSLFNAGNAPYDVVTGDFNGDGKLDLAVSNTDPSAPAAYILIGNGDGTFAAPVAYPVNARSDILVTGDLNRDGKLDLVVSNFATGNVSVLLGNGDGSFGVKTDYIGVANSGMILADVNNDGFADVVTANENGTISVFLGSGLGTLLPAIHYWTGNSAAIAAGSFTSSGTITLALGDAIRGGVMLLLNSTVPSMEPGYPRISINGETTAQVVLKSTIVGTAYADCLPSGSTAPTPYQIRYGLDSSYADLTANMKGLVAVTAHNQAAVTFSALTKGALYDVYVIVEDSTSTLQPVPGFVSFTQPQTASYTLAVTVNGDGTVAGSSTTIGDTGSINCQTGTCSATFPASHTVNLTAVAPWFSSITWGNIGTASGNSAAILMDAPKDVSVTFSAAENVRISNPAGFLGSISLGLASAIDGSTIKAKAIHFPDLITFSKTNTTINLLGGLAQLSDVSPSGYSTIQGPFKITHGRLNFKGGIKIQP